MRRTGHLKSQITARASWRWIGLAGLAWLGGCDVDVDVGGISDNELDDELRGVLADAGVFSVTPPPVQDSAEVELGRLMFFDKELSGRRNISCGTCHSPLLGSADGQSQSRGQGAEGLGPARIQGPDSLFLSRNALGLWNRGVDEWDTMFWDGRMGVDDQGAFFSPAGADTPQNFTNPLTAFSIIPFTPDEEMRGFINELDVFGDANEMDALTNDDFAEIWPLVVDRALGVPEYNQALQDVYGVAEQDVDIVHVSEAIGAFMTEAFTVLDTPFDRYLAGDDLAMSRAAKQGALLFYGRANCGSCHAGGLTTDLSFYNVATPQVGTGRGDQAPLDLGRFLVTGDPADNYKFRTPALRNIELEGPWMHNGAFAELEDVVRHHLDPEASLLSYDDGQVEPELVGTYQDDPALIDDLLVNVAPELAVDGDPLTEVEISDLMAFLGALTDPDSLNMFEVFPDSVPSGLPVAD